MTKDRILAALPKLAQADLEAIHAMSGALLNGRTAALPVQGGEPALTIFNALAATAGAAISLQTLSPKLRKAFDGKVGPLECYLSRHFSGWDKHKLSQMAFLQALFDLLKTNLMALELTPSLTLMINNLHRMPRIIEDAYPDYLQAGLGDLILKHYRVKNDRMVKKPKETLESLLVPKGTS